MSETVNYAISKVKECSTKNDMIKYLSSYRKSVLLDIVKTIGLKFNSGSTISEIASGIAEYFSFIKLNEKMSDR